MTSSFASPRGRRGSALVLALLLAVILVAVTAGLALRMSGERRVSLDDAAQNDALNAAQSAMNAYFALTTTVPRTGLDSTRVDTVITVSGGAANVSVRRVRDGLDATDPKLYVVISRGTTTRNRSSSAVPNAERAMVQFAEYRTSDFAPTAALTSLSGVSKTGGSGGMIGFDKCGQKDDLPGVAVPNGGYTQTGSGTPISGSSDNDPVYIGSEGSSGTAKDAVNVDWQTLISPSGLPYDYVFPSGVDNPQKTAWNALFPTTSSPYQLILIVGDAEFEGSGWNPGRSVLVITGSLRVNGAWKNDGLVLVGGNLDSNGGNTFYGSVVTGLNVKIPGSGFGSEDVVTNDPLSGTKVFEYDSCKLDSALTKLGRLRPVSNAQLTNYPIF